jgi:hypothetical protein
MKGHIAKDCDVKDCRQEATFWIELPHYARQTFYLCIDHQYELNGHDENEGYYVRLGIGTGEITKHEIGKYACHPECEACAE